MYLIDTPPPTISGKLHIGHIFSYSQGSIIAKYHKYLKEDVLHPFCFDNNGIPTAKLASKNGIYEPEEILKFSIDHGHSYRKTFDDCGIEFSNHSYSTHDDLSTKICLNAFEELKKLGIAYKKEAEFLWCPVQKISISQSELDDNGIIEKSGVAPEIKTGEGWFINLKDHLPEIRKCIEKIQWHPEYFKKTALDWCDGLKWDWSISRERKFGIKIPGETSTFDTWFISALSPQLAYASLTGKDDFKCPRFDLRYQAHDIIKTWAFYTIAMSYFLNKDIPWENIVITGHAIDVKGDKFSKSSGNATMPDKVLAKHEVSGIKFWSTSASLGSNIQIDENQLHVGWRLRNKFKNAKKFIDFQRKDGKSGIKQEYYDEWLKYKTEILNHMAGFNLNAASALVYKFLWNVLCDLWIEESKKESIVDTLDEILIDLEPILDWFA